MRRLHVWLAWIAGVPLLLWTVSGAWMVARPIEEVRGTGLRAEPKALILPSSLRPPAGPLKSLTLERQAQGVVWIAVRPTGESFRSDPATGRKLPSLQKAEATALATAALRRPAATSEAMFSPADKPPLDLRRSRPAWGVQFADGMRVYIDADTGQVLALRSRQWRIFDWMWGLHIMDLSGREDTSHPILIGSAVLALLATLMGLILLPLTIKRRR